MTPSGCMAAPTRGPSPRRRGPLGGTLRVGGGEGKAVSSAWPRHAVRRAAAQPLRAHPARRQGGDTCRCPRPGLAPRGAIRTPRLLTPNARPRTLQMTRVRCCRYSGGAVERASNAVRCAAGCSLGSRVQGAGRAALARSAGGAAPCLASAGTRVRGVLSRDSAGRLQQPACSPASTCESGGAVCRASAPSQQHESASRTCP